MKRKMDIITIEKKIERKKEIVKEEEKRTRKFVMVKEKQKLECSKKDEHFMTFDELINSFKNPMNRYVK